MSIVHDVISFGGTTQPEADTKFVVSYWYIPGGYNYVNAEARVAYFADEAAATKFEKEYEYPPEMAFTYEYKPAHIQEILT